MGGVPQKEGSPVISERMAQLLRERWKEGLTGGAGLSGGAGERDWALAGRARAGGGERVRQAERDEAEGWAARERVGRGWTEREVWAECRSIDPSEMWARLVWCGLGRSVGELGRGKKEKRGNGPDRVGLGLRV